MGIYKVGEPEGDPEDYFYSRHEALAMAAWLEEQEVKRLAVKAVRPRRLAGIALGLLLIVPLVLGNVYLLQPDGPHEVWEEAPYGRQPLYFVVVGCDDGVHGIYFTDSVPWVPQITGDNVGLRSGPR